MANITWPEWLQEQWMANRDERSAWGQQPLTRDQYIAENLAWLTEAYAEHMRLSQVAQRSSQTSKTT